MSERTEKLKTSQREAFASLYDGSFACVYGFVYARTGSAAKTEEILQETYAAAWAAMGGFRNQCSGSTWLTAIARRKIADHYRRAIRRERREEPLEDPDSTPSGPDPEEILTARETRERVSIALGRLCPLYRYALVMKYLEGRTMKEIALALHRTPKAVDGILQRAKAGFIRNYQSASGEGENDGR